MPEENWLKNVKGNPKNLKTGMQIITTANPQNINIIAPIRDS